MTEHNDDDDVAGATDDEGEDLTTRPDDNGSSRSDGVSAVAIRAAQQWEGPKRPAGWQGRVYGLVVHTTGSGLPAKARDLGVAQINHAVKQYTELRPGCHYVNGWLGV